MYEREIEGALADIITDVGFRPGSTYRCVCLEGTDSQVFACESERENERKSVCVSETVKRNCVGMLDMTQLFNQNANTEPSHLCVCVW